MFKKPSCYWMIGISGSGKSCKAKEIADKKDATVLSSDAIRKELYGDESIQGNPEEVFKLLHNRAIGLLKMGFSIVYDATNLSLKNRIKFFQLLNNAGIEAEHHAIVMSKSIQMCIEDNNKRERVVPEEVIHKQSKQFNMPFFEEGFKTITISGWDNFTNVTQDDERYISQSLVNHTSMLILMDKFNQNNPHHELTLGEHCNKVLNIVNNFSDDIPLLVASQIHDIGKLYTEEKDKKGRTFYHDKDPDCRRR